MATRVVEGKKPYTGGEAIDIDQNKVISLKLRDENNLIIYDSGDDEIYVDLQLPDGITPTDAFPVGVTTGRVVVADGWDKAGTIICAKTTSGDNIKLLYADDGTLWIDNGTGTFKQIYFKADVDALITTLTTYINTELAKKQNGVASATAPSNPSEGDLWYDTTNSAMKVWDGAAWQSVGTGGGSDIEYVTQVEYDALPSSKLTDGKHYVIYTSDSPTPPSPGWQPGANTIAYYNIDDNDSSTIYDKSGNNRNLTYTANSYTTLSGPGKVMNLTGGQSASLGSSINAGNEYTFIVWVQYSTASGYMAVFGQNASSSKRPSIALANENQSNFCYFSEGYTIMSAPFTVGQWYCVCCTRDNTGKAIMYLDGNLSAQASNTNIPDYSGGEGFHLGAWRTGEQYMKGYIKSFILENKVRTTQEISDYYDQTKGDYGIS